MTEIIDNPDECSEDKLKPFSFDDVHEFLKNDSLFGVDPFESFSLDNEGRTAN